MITPLVSSNSSYPGILEYSKYKQRSRDQDIALLMFCTVVCNSLTLSGTNLATRGNITDSLSLINVTTIDRGPKCVTCFGKSHVPSTVLVKPVLQLSKKSLKIPN